MKMRLLCIGALLVVLAMSPWAAQVGTAASDPDSDSYMISGDAHGTPQFYPLLPFRVFYPNKLGGLRFRVTQMFYHHAADAGYPTATGGGGFTCPSSWSESRCLSVNTPELTTPFETSSGIPALLAAGLVDPSTTYPVTVWFGFRDLTMKSTARMIQIAEWRASDRQFELQGTPMTIQGITATVAVAGTTTTVFLVRHGTAILLSSNRGVEGTVAVVKQLTRLYTSI
jgi:hypothetical protein